MRDWATVFEQHDDIMGACIRCHIMRNTVCVGCNVLLLGPGTWLAALLWGGSWRGLVELSFAPVGSYGVRHLHGAALLSSIPWWLNERRWARESP